MSHPYPAPYSFPDQRGGLDDDRPNDEDLGKTGTERPRPDSPDADLDVPDDEEEDQ